MSVLDRAEMTLSETRPVYVAPSAAGHAAAIEASIPPIRSAIAQREHHLAVLIGVRPGGLGVDLTPRAYPPLTKALAIGEPGSLLRRRPDVRAAERRLASATGREGVAAAELFPQISISGFLGLLAERLQFARLGGDARAQLGGVRYRQRARPVARR